MSFMFKVDSQDDGNDKRDFLSVTAQPKIVSSMVFVLIVLPAIFADLDRL